MGSADLKALLKRVFELVMPDLRAYYRVTRKARVVKTYASDGRYWADVQPLRNDESIDPDEPVVTRVEIPVVWAGPKRGVVCPPEEGVLCDLSYYDGDPDYPRISNFRWQGMVAPEVEIGGFIIQREPGTYIKVGADNTITCETPADWNEIVGGAWNVTVTGPASVTSGDSVTVVAPQINLGGADRATLRQLVDERFKTLYEQHTHPGVTAGADSSGPPNETFDLATNCTDVTRGI